MTIDTEPHPTANDYDDPDRHPVCEDCGTPHELDGGWYPVCSCPDLPWEVGTTYGGCVRYGVDYQSENGCTFCDLERRPVRHPWAVRYLYDHSDRCPLHRGDSEAPVGVAV